MSAESDLRRRSLIPGSPISIGVQGQATTPAQQLGPGTGARTTQIYAEVVAGDATPRVRTTQIYAEVVARDTTPALRMTQIYAEVVCERDYAGWGVLIADDSMVLD